MRNTFIASRFTRVLSGEMSQAFEIQVFIISSVLKVLKEIAVKNNNLLWLFFFNFIYSRLKRSVLKDQFKIRILNFSFFLLQPSDRHSPVIAVN